MNIAVYISGHGFGHLAQMAPVLNQISRMRPDSQFLIRCSLPKEEIRARLLFDCEIEQSPVDVGVVQKTAIEEDREASVAGLRAWLDSMDEQLGGEYELLQAFEADLVISDISPLAFPAARALGVPGIGLATLDWFTIYSHWLSDGDPALKQLNDAYRQCDLLLTPPMAMDMHLFPNRIQIPLIAAYPSGRSCPFEKTHSKTALVIFGGSDQPVFDLQALSVMDEWQFLIPYASDNAPDNVTAIAFGSDMMAVDLMPFVDVVVCKPGYGILSECWRTKTPMAWVERPDFPEYPMLKVWLEDVLPSASMSRSEFAGSKWMHALEAAQIQTRAFPDLKVDGAEAAAGIILSRLVV
ncbi:hypothetical protein MMIC_P1560 [Mariprofundus micogutta]|uniref:Glycosyl transferase n=1 Tax=Mariprofundus micogutta TaxID=1921010 RepID=A0A1L8CNU9_9PROT|nr:hypothetical protein [Mariprofundus micogutta]GAV20591.1 hypothetical protein MMIC_P1560 [Mariprofundus micogutta]